MAWQLDWYYFGDAACMAAGSTDRTKQLLGKLLAHDAEEASRQQEAETRLRDVFGLRTAPVSGEARLFRLIREVALADPARARFRWDTMLASLDVQIVTMPPGREGEMLVTPGTLYLSWPFFANDEASRETLAAAVSGVADLSIGTLPAEATTGQHMWMMATMKAADTLALHLPEALPADDPNGTMTALRVMAQVLQGTENGALPWPPAPPRADAPASIDLGRFTALPRRTGLRRDETFLWADGTAADGSLTLQIGTGENVSLDAKGPKPAPMFCEWPCGTLNGGC